MSTLRDWLDFSPPVPPVDAGPVHVRSVYQAHNDNLIIALEAALAVIDWFELEVTEGDAKLRAELFVALEPFRKDSTK